MTYSVDEKIPAAWVKDSVLSTRYWKEGAPVFAGTVLRIGVLLTTGSEDGRRFAICVTDPGKVVGNLSGEADFESDLNKDKNGGLRVLGTFVGKYGLVELNTYDLEPGTYFLYSYALNSRKAWKFSENAIAIQIAPSLSEMIPALQNEPDEILKTWGLASYPTLEEVVGQRDQSSAFFDISFADGGKMSSVKMPGRPSVGRILGVFTDDELLGIAKIDSISDGVVRSSSSSKFLHNVQGRESQLKAAWVIRTEVYSTKGNRDITLKQHQNLMTFPDGPVGSATFGLQNMVYEMFQAGVVHLNEPFKKNTSLDYQQMYQNWTAAKHTYVLAPTESYVPEVKAKQLRVVRLGPGGIPIVKVDEATVSRVDSPGLWSGLSYIIGQRVHRPDRTSVSNNSSNTATAPTTNNVDVNSVNNNSNANTNVNPINNTINVGDGSANGTATGTGDSNSVSGP
ncbi:MAG: hypothetical protein WCV58_02545 [Patescibacteria group bacterium]